MKIRKPKPAKVNSKYTMQDLRDNGMIILEYKTGSHLYGTNISQSDRDFKGVYVMPDEDFAAYDYSPDWEEVKSGKVKGEDGIEEEYTFYDIRKFMNLLQASNPNILECFNIPEDCLVYIHPCFRWILNYRHLFVTKDCFRSFSGYALEQTNKAKGQNKKQNWEKSRFERKSVLDFCYVAHKQGSIPVKQWLNLPIEKPWTPENGYGFKKRYQEFCGLVKVDHMPNTFGLYYDEAAHAFYEKTNSLAAAVREIHPMESILHSEAAGLFFKYKGLVSNEETANALSKSDVPVGESPVIHMTFNENAWSMHCDEYHSYLVWQKERNDQRWVDVKEHGQKIDGKNMLHMQRLMNMAMDIASGKGIITRRPEAAELIKIRKGEVPLQELLDSSKAKLDSIKDMFDKSELLEKVDPSACVLILNEMRSTFKKERDNYKKTSDNRSFSIRVEIDDKPTIWDRMKMKFNF